MRILIFSQQFASFRSGVGTYAYGLASGLSALEHKVTVVVPKSEKIEINALNFITVPCFQYDPTPGGWLSLGVFFARILNAQGKYYDIAHFTDAREAWAVRRFPIPVTGMVNDSYALDWLKPDYPRRFFSDKFFRSSYYKLLRTVEKRIYPRLGNLITNSAHTAMNIIEGYHLDQEDVHIIGIGILDKPMVHPISLSGSPSILFVGGNFHRKGLSILLEAVARLLPRFSNIRLHIVGKDRNQPFFVDYISKLGIANAVEFYGWQPNEKVRGMMAGADIFTLPSFNEGFGLVYLEAMRAGAPVIATLNGGASEFFLNGEEALFVNPGRAEELASAIERIATEPQLAFRLRERGKAAVKLFTVDAMAKKTEEILYATLTKSRKL